MNNKDTTKYENPKSFFIKRAPEYNNSSRWVNDSFLIEKIFTLANPDQSSLVLEIAVGTGKISAAFHNRVKKIIGVDICDFIVQQSKDYIDDIIISNAESMPFKENMFDICICRQGLQFMDVDKVLLHVRRILKTEGRVVFCHLTAYDNKDKDITFQIQRLRNPARKNFFLPEDLYNSLLRFEFKNVEMVDYFSRESINQWIENSAIGEKEKSEIKNIYKMSTDEFKRKHKIEFVNGDIFDTMKFVIVTGRK